MTYKRPSKVDQTAQRRLIADAKALCRCGCHHGNTPHSGDRCRCITAPDLVIALYSHGGESSLGAGQDA